MFNAFILHFKLNAGVTANFTKRLFKWFAAKNNIALPPAELGRNVVVRTAEPEDANRLGEQAAGDHIAGDATVWEREPMESLARPGQMSAFHHHGFWQPMDTLRDKVYLEELWASGRAPWKVWQ